MLIALRILSAALSLALVTPPGLAASGYEAAPPVVARPSDKIALSDALDLASRRVPKGRVVDAGLRLRDGHRAWDVEMLRDGKKVTVWIDAADGTIKVHTAGRN